MAEECVKNDHNKLKAESNFRHQVEKTLGLSRRRRPSWLRSSKCLSRVARVP